MKDIEKIRERAAAARDDNYYDKVYSLIRWFSGDDRLMLSDGTTATLSDGGSHGDPDMPDYPYVELPLGAPGIHNHGMVNSRINIQSVVYADPEFVYTERHPVIRGIVAGFVKKRWEEGDWGSVFMEAGMEVEAAGLGFVEIGIRDSAVTVEHRSVLDMLWDRGHRSRGKWRFVFIRNRLDVDEVLEKYAGIVTEEEATALARETRLSAPISSVMAWEVGELTQVREWSYWDKDHHVVFLGSISQEDSIILRLKERDAGRFEYERVGDGNAGPNPFGVVPVSIWTDSWAPGVLRPVSKTEQTWRIARMLNELEAHVVNTISREIPITILSTANMSPEQISRISKAQSYKDVGMIIPVDMADVTNVVNRVPGGGVATGVLQSIQYYKELINAVTGVMDAQRGQPIPGDRTAEEVRTLSSAQGIQNKHLRRQYSSFLKDVVKKACKIASKFDRKPMEIQVGKSMVNTSQVQISEFLDMDWEVYVRENTLVYESEQDKILARLQEFQAVDLKAIELHVADPMKVFKDLYEDIGVTDVTSRMYSDQEMRSLVAQKQAAEEEAAFQEQMTMQQGEQNA